MRGGLLLFGLAGCTFSPVELTDGGNGGHDMRPRDGCVTFSQQVDTCTLPAGGSDLVLDGTYRFDTATGTLMHGTVAVPVTAMTLTTLTNHVEIEAILVHDLSLTSGAQLRGVGPRPFAIIATGRVQLGNTALIDVGIGGSGARASCPSMAARGESGNGGAGGGGGGGFGADGAAGGTGNANGFEPEHPGGSGGRAVTAPAGPLGGCPGAKGGDGNDTGGDGGLGGGAIYIVSASRIELAAGSGINAGGGGGGGGHQGNGNEGDAGGGGGGSGGMILLEAPQLRSVGFLGANGGGAGEGSGGYQSGAAGAAAINAMRASGGGGNTSSGSDGGAGGAAAGPAASPSSIPSGGGGGGGGGVGFIRVVSPDPQLGTLVSPAAS